MALHNKIGTEGEAFANEYLQRNGYAILHRNWRYVHKEIDIVAFSGGMLIFIEVKTRTAAMDANDVISEAKIRFLRDAAEAYISTYNRLEEMRFDVMLLTARNGGFHVEHICDAFR